MKSKVGIIESILCFILVVSILPSFTGLTNHFLSFHTFLSFYKNEILQILGPINFLKLGFPLILYFIVSQFSLRFSQLNKKFIFTFFGAILVLILSTILTSLYCIPVPLTLIRETAIIFLSFFAALAFYLLSIKRQRLIIQLWAFIVFGLVLLNFISESSIQWLLSNVFDPNTTSNDALEAGEVITSVFGRQSLAKILSWLPWLFWFYETKNKSIEHLVGIFRQVGFWLCLLSTGLILSTSQRGPLLGSIVGWVLFIYFNKSLFQQRFSKILLGLFGVAVLGLVLLTTPIELIKARLFFMSNQQSQLAISAQTNSVFRLKMTQLTVNQIFKKPLGNACIDPKEFHKLDISHFSHAHNLFLHQLRERGWFWGFVHLFLWFIVFRNAFNVKGKAILAALILNVMVSGMFDHPWNVLNHGLILWIILFNGFEFSSEQGTV